MNNIIVVVSFTPFEFSENGRQTKNLAKYSARGCTPLYYNILYIMYTDIPYIMAKEKRQSAKSLGVRLYIGTYTYETMLS
jgi:hypothetical protein